jgi:hypothetical protein
MAAWSKPCTRGNAQGRQSLHAINFSQWLRSSAGPPFSMPPPQKHRRSPSPSPGPSLRPRRDHVAPSSSSSATVNTAQPSAHRHFVGPQSLAGLPSPVLRLLIRPGVGSSNLAQMTAAPRSVGQHSPHLAFLPDPLGSASFEQSVYKSPGMFNQARDCTVTGTFVDGNGEIPSIS